MNNILNVIDKVNRLINNNILNTTARNQQLNDYEVRWQEYIVNVLLPELNSFIERTDLTGWIDSTSRNELNDFSFIIRSDTKGIISFRVVCSEFRIPSLYVNNDVNLKIYKIYEELANRKDLSRLFMKYLS